MAYHTKLVTFQAQVKVTIACHPTADNEEVVKWYLDDQVEQARRGCSYCGPMASEAEEAVLEGYEVVALDDNVTEAPKPPYKP